MKAALAGLALGALVATALNLRKPTLDVPEKARAFALELAGAPSIHAGDHIDVLSVMAEPDSKRLFGVTLLQNVIVLDAAPRQLTVLVLPEEAQLLALAREGGTLSVTLRNPADDGVLEGTALATISSTLLGRLLPPPRK